MRKYAWMAALLLVAGCADSTVTPGSAGMAGVSDVVRVGDLVFVTSANRSELRVLDTVPNVAQNQKDADWVRAPNPLKYLSIPVLQRPVSLHTDAWFRPASGDIQKGELKGTEMPGRYVFVRGSGARELSIVGAARDQLTELRRLTTDGPVTAVAAYGAEGDQDSVLFYAEDFYPDGAASEPRIQRVLVPPVNRLAQTDLTAASQRAEVLDAAGQPLRFRDANGQPEQVISLLVLPRLEGDTGLQLAVATRNVHGTGGSAYLLSLGPDGAQERADAPRVTLDFGGPVRALFTHAAGRKVPGTEAAKATDVIPAGARIFGVLDEGFCPSALQCGVVAVDTIDAQLPHGLPMAQRGQRSKDWTGRTMVPIHMRNALIQGLTIASGSTIDTTRWSELLGIVTASDGRIAFFDAQGLQHFDIQGPSTVAAGSFNLFKADGMPVYEDPTVRTTKLVDLTRALAGAVAGLYQVPIGVEGVEGDKGKPAFVLSNRVVVGADALKNVRVGDKVELLRGVSDQTIACAEPLTVASLDAASNSLTLSDVIPDSGDASTRCTLLTVRPATFEILKDGVVRQQGIRLTYQGELPGLTALPVPAPGAQSVSLSADLAGRVRVGDFLQFSSAGAACAVGADVKVTGVVPGATPQDASTVTLSAPMPADCTAYTVRAGTEKPWVMTGTVEPYFGRVARDARTGDDVIRGTPYYHPGGLRDDLPAVDFYFSLPADLVPETGMYVYFGVSENWQAYSFVQSPANPMQDFYLPGGVVFVPEMQTPLLKAARVYVAYPSASALLEFKPGSDPQPLSQLVYGAPYR